MKIEINVFLKENELDKLSIIVKEYDKAGFVLSDTIILPRSAEYMYTFTERRNLEQ